MLLFALLVIAGFGLYVLTPEERRRLAEAALAPIRHAGVVAAERRAMPDAFRDAVHARTPMALVAPALVLANVTMFVLMLLGRGAMGDPSTLLAWGASSGPATTNGEWSRLVTALFLHAGLLHLLATSVGFFQIGVLMERLVGRLAFAAVYFTAGILAGLQSLASDPVTLSAGPAGAVFGIYGLFLAAVLWSTLQNSSGEPLPADESAEPAVSGRRPLRIPLRMARDLGPGAAVFFLYYAIAGVTSAEITGLLGGFLCGLVLARGVTERTAGIRQVAVVVAAMAIIVAASALMLRRVTDVRPEIARLVALEDRIAGAYDEAVAQFRKGSLSAEALAQIIDQSIVPELQTAHARIRALTGIPPEHEPLVAGAEEYFRLRGESWRLRAEGLHKRNMPALRHAQGPEREALEALQRIAPAGQE